MILKFMISLNHIISSILPNDNSHKSPKKLFL